MSVDMPPNTKSRELSEVKPMLSRAAGGVPETWSPERLRQVHVLGSNSYKSLVLSGRSDGNHQQRILILTTSFSSPHRSGA